jgi:hypothetical protein
LFLVNETTLSGGFVRRLLFVAILAVPCTTAFAGFDEVLKQACSTGNPWKLPAMENAETPISLNNNTTRLVTICNCTEPGADQIDAGVYVLTLASGPAVPAAKRLMARRPVPKGATKRDDLQPGPGQTIDYLPGGSCTAAGSGSVVLHTADHRGLKWGTWQLEPPPK